jgi:transcriptional regulator with XRE-family HTH domain
VTVREAFARRLRALREQRRLSQAALAERVTDLGVPIERAAVTRIEWAADPERSDRARNVSLEEAVAFAAALDVPLYALLLGDADTETNITPELGVRTPFFTAWLGGVMPLDSENVEFYREAGENTLALRAAQARIMALSSRGLNEIETRMAKALVEMNLRRAEEIERVAAQLPAEQAEQVEASARRVREEAAELKEALPKERKKR